MCERGLLQIQLFQIHPRHGRRHRTVAKCHPQPSQIHQIKSEDILTQLQTAYNNVLFPNKQPWPDDADNWLLTKLYFPDIYKGFSFESLEIIAELVISSLVLGIMLVSCE